jgi:hypothetical protein
MYIHRLNLSYSYDCIDCEGVDFDNFNVFQRGLYLISYIRDNDTLPICMKKDIKN